MLTLRAVDYTEKMAVTGAALVLVVRKYLH